MGVLYTLFLASAIYIVAQFLKLQYRSFKLRSIPSVGGADGFIASYIAGFKSFRHARDMIQEGYDKYEGRIFKFPGFNQWRILVTNSKFVDEIRKAPDDTLSFDEAVVETLQVHYTMGSPIHDDPYHIEVVRGPLTRNIAAKFDDVRDEIVTAFDEQIPPTKEWSKHVAMKDIMRIVARASNRLFVGLPLCRNAEYLDLNVAFAMQVVLSGVFINLFPSFLKPLVGKLSSTVPRSIKKARTYLEPIIAERLQRVEEDGPNYSDRPEDMLMWLIDAATTGPRRTIHDLTMRILTVNFAAIHTSSMSFADSLFTLAAHPQYVDELREEVESVVQEYGWSKNSLQRMRKVDSFLKEAERNNGMGAVISDRKVLKDFTFSDGTTVPAGSTVGIPRWALHHDERYYEDPNEFKPWRSFQMREDEGGVKHQMITPTSTYVMFGCGRHACPGRFFAVNELKMLFTHVLLNYDVKFEDGRMPEPQWFGVSCSPNRDAEVMFRKRQR